MQVVTLVAVVISAFLAIASGIWVAVALVKAISAHRPGPAARRQADEKSGDQHT